MYFDRKTTVALRSRVAILRPLMNAFYLSGALILLRSIYRVVGECKMFRIVFNANVSQNLLRSTSTKGPLTVTSITPNGHTMSLMPYQLLCVSYCLVLSCSHLFHSWLYFHTTSCSLPSTSRRQKMKDSQRRILWIRSRSEWDLVSNYNGPRVTAHAFINTIFFGVQSLEPFLVPMMRYKGP
jgi:hypothetical protein